MSQTFAIIKPDVVKKNKQADIISVILKKQFDITELRKVHLTQEQVEGFYAEHSDKPFFKDLCSFMSSGPCYVMRLECDEAVRQWRKLIGDTNPFKAKEGTIRALFGESIDCNAVHGSDSDESAERELSFFFS